MPGDPSLKPCPFCGHPPEMRQRGVAGTYYVMCTACQIELDERMHSPAEAAIRWNLRAPIEITPTLLDSAQLIYNTLAERHGEPGCLREAMRVALRETIAIALGQRDAA